MSMEEGGARPLQEQLESLRKTTNRLEERIKEGQPSFLGALRTLVFDYQEFAAGKRDFPQAALLGVVFAYLRPRVVLIFGSLAAVVVAFGQVWLLARQNTIIEQQNKLISEQGRSLRAQTAAALLAGLDANEPSEATISLLSTFGDIGVDSLLMLAKQPDGNAGRAARKALVGAVENLTIPQRSSVLQMFVLAHTQAIELLHIRGSATSIPRRWGTGSAWIPVVELSEWDVDPARLDLFRDTGEDLSDVLSALSRRSGFDLKTLSQEQSRELLVTLAEMYVEYFALFGQALEQKDRLDSPGGLFLDLDNEASDLCLGLPPGNMNLDSPSIGNLVRRGIENLRKAVPTQHPLFGPQDVQLGTVVAVAVAKVCAPNRPGVAEALASVLIDLSPEELSGEVELAEQATPSTSVRK